MLKSMTAFSRKESVSDLGTLMWEMRSVNHRYLDVSLRLADELRVIEPLVREKLSEKLSRMSRWPKKYWMPWLKLTRCMVTMKN